MKANELRIGSLVIYKWFDKSYECGKQRTIIHREIVKVLAVDSVNNRVLIKTNQTRKNHTWVSISAISPAPLKEEILLKCGFVKVGKYTFINNNSLMNLEISIVGNKILHSILALEIKYLHQIQNLYFALTGEELEVKI